MPSPSNAEVIEFIASYVGIPSSRISSDSTLVGDLGVDGDDGSELLAAFSARYCVDLSEFEFSTHFGPEGFLPWAPFQWLVQWLRPGYPEAKAGLTPLTIADLLRAVEAGRWEPGNNVVGNNAAVRA